MAAKAMETGDHPISVFVRIIFEVVNASCINLFMNFPAVPTSKATL